MVLPDRFITLTLALSPGINQRSAEKEVEQAGKRGLSKELGRILIQSNLLHSSPSRRSEVHSLSTETRIIPSYVNPLHVPLKEVVHLLHTVVSTGSSLTSGSGALLAPISHSLDLGIIAAVRFTRSECIHEGPRETPTAPSHLICPVRLWSGCSILILVMGPVRFASHPISSPR